jgi:predicted PhzF superfamily epimerase YddE/YHI9
VRIPIHHVDAFASRLHAGNPAAVCLLSSWLDAETMRSIAMENHLPATAFCLPGESPAPIRWFRGSGAELDLCGHGTLAAASVCLERAGGDAITFLSAGGPLTVVRDGAWFVLDLPARPAEPASPPAALIEALGAHAIEWRRAKAWLARFESEADVRALAPDFAALAGFEPVIVTAAGTQVDFVSRYFTPRSGVTADAATGSPHCALAPYWASRLGRTTLEAHQLSARGGEIR